MTRQADPPLFAGAIHGVRTWEVRSTGRRPRLMAIATPRIWHPDPGGLRAICHATRRHAADQVPHPDCTCGFYANHPWTPDAFDRAEFALAEPRVCQVAGVVEAWGDIEVHNDGFRAEWVRPAIVFGTPSRLHLARRIASVYGAQAMLVPSRSRLREVLAGLECLRRPLVESLLEAGRRILLVPAKGKHARSTGFEVRESDGRGAAHELGWRVRFRARSPEDLETLARSEFGLTRAVVLRPAGTRGRMPAVDILDAAKLIRLGVTTQIPPELPHQIDLGRVNRAVVFWQERRRATGARFAINIFATPLAGFDVKIGKPARVVELNEGDSIF